jgi:hypothetical protein
MLMDLQSMFSNRQAIIATAPSTDQIDLGVVDTPRFARAPITRDLGRARPFPIHIQVIESFNNLTSLTVALQVDNDVAFGSPKTLITTVVPLAGLVAGAVIPPFFLPVGVDERYVRLLYTVTGTAPTLGRITAGFQFGRSNWRA